MHKIITVIIPTFNSENHIEDCMRSLRKELNKYLIRANIVIVDNASKDGTIEKVNQKGVKVIRNKDNYGFATAANIGIRRSKSEYVLLLNPDTVILDGAINNLLHCAEANNASIASGLIFNFCGHKQYSYAEKPDIATLLFVYSNLRKLVPRDFFHKKHYYVGGRINNTKEVDVVTGGFMLINRFLFKRIGYFDEHFFMYLEDVDFCLRAKARGEKIIVCGRSRIKHYGGASSPNKDRILHSAWINSRKYFVRKNFSSLTNLFVQSIFFLDTVVIRGRKLMKYQNS